MVGHKDMKSTSSNAVMVYLPTPLHARQAPHEAFANLRDDDAAIEQFTRTWGQISNLPLIEAAKLDWRDKMRLAWRGDAKALKELQWWANQYIRTDLTVSDSRIEMKADQLLGTIYLLFLCDYLKGRTGICANPDCTQPYFIKKRPTRKFCEDPKCSAYAQRQYALKSWRLHGAEWRPARKKKSTKKGGK